MHNAQGFNKIWMVVAFKYSWGQDTGCFSSPGNTQAEIQSWSHQGYIAVDMETATTFAVAEYFRMQCLSLLFVFDNPSQGEHILLSDVEKQRRRENGEQAVIDTVFAIIEKYENGNR